MRRWEKYRRFNGSGQRMMWGLSKVGLILWNASTTTFAAIHRWDWLFLFKLDWAQNNPEQGCRYLKILALFTISSLAPSFHHETSFVRVVNRVPFTAGHRTQVCHPINWILACHISHGFHYGPCMEGDLWRRLTRYWTVKFSTRSADLLWGGDRKFMFAQTRDKAWDCLLTAKMEKIRRGQMSRPYLLIPRSWFPSLRLLFR